MTRIYAASAVILIGALAALAVGWQMLGRQAETATTDPYDPCRTTDIIGGADQVGGPFELVDETGDTVTDEQVITEPSILYFGYTFCPDVCPLDTMRNVEAVEILAERGYDVQPVFISIDPARDTSERLAEYTSFMHPDLLGLTGSEAQVAAASQAYRTYYNRHDETDDEFYLVDHSTFSYLVMPEDGFVEFFRRNLAPAEMADRVQCFLDARPAPRTAGLVQ